MRMKDLMINAVSLMRLDISNLILENFKCNINGRLHG